MNHQPSTNSLTSSTIDDTKALLVPKGLTLTMAGIMVVMVLVVFGYPLLMGATLAQMMPRLLGSMLVFWVLVPCLFLLGANVLNRFSGKPPIQTRNALTLAFLSSSMAVLWLMAANS